MAKGSKKSLTAAERDKLLGLLKARFEKNMKRHKGLGWGDVQARLEKNPDKLWSLHAMEESGGEPDVIGKDGTTIIFCDCAAESPIGRRSICYDREGLDSRKEFKPKDTAMDMAEEMGITMMTEEQYRDLQKLGAFDAKTSSWLKTPEETRKLGGAIFGDFRFGRVFIYHNGASSYYAGRGFRGMLYV